MRLYMNHTGPMMVYVDGVLEVSDLNPEIFTQWRMSRVAMLRLAWNCLLAAMKI